jgi:hypothetical protein
MKFGRSMWLRAFLLAAFLGFQVGASLHSHTASVSDDNCAICQVVHHTPSDGAPAAVALQASFVFQSLAPTSAPDFVPGDLTDLARSRAPPAA